MGKIEKLMDRLSTIQFTRMVMTGVMAVMLVAFFCGSAGAFKIATGNEDLELNWDNTVKWNYGFRLHHPDSCLLTINADDGDRNFNKGTITNRLDLYSEADLVYKKEYGVRVSGAFWYDQRYHDPLGNDSPATSNYMENGQHVVGLSNPARRLYAGPDGELLDAFVFGRVDLGSMPLRIRVGRHVVYWGETLFQTQAISYGQSPIDGAKGAAVPGSLVKELYLPLNQISAQLQITPALAIQAQQFLEWKPLRIPEAGTFFGTSDVVGNGGGSLFPAPTTTWTRGDDIEPTGLKNWGVAVHWSPEFMNTGVIGLYYRKTADTVPTVLPIIAESSFIMTYQDDIDIYGISLSRVLFGWSVGAEFSYRHNMPLSSDSGGLLMPGQPKPDKGDTLGPRGDTMHGIVNILKAYPASPIYDGNGITAELYWTSWAKVTQREDIFIGRDGYDGINKWERNAIGGTLSLSPQWFDVPIPGWQLTVPLTYSRGLYHNGMGTNQDAGSFSAALSFDIYARHNLNLQYSTFFGNSTLDAAGRQVAVLNGGMAGQTDRANIALTFKTSF